jgi:hypothetical protein
VALSTTKPRQTIDVAFGDNPVSLQTIGVAFGDNPVSLQHWAG